MLHEVLGPELSIFGLAAGMTAAVAINPLGTEIYAFPFEFTAAQSLVTRLINEWKPLFGNHRLEHSLHLMSYWAYLAFACVTLAVAAARGRLGRLEVGLLLAFGLLPLRHIRWVALFALMAAPPLASLLARVEPAQTSTLATGSPPTSTRATTARSMRCTINARSETNTRRRPM